MQFPGKLRQAQVTAVILGRQAVEPTRESGVATCGQQLLGLCREQVRGKAWPSRVDTKLDSLMDGALLGKLSHQSAEVGTTGNPGNLGGSRH